MKSRGAVELPFRSSWKLKICFFEIPSLEGLDILTNY
jgi:hypothetical protein